MKGQTMTNFLIGSILGLGVAGILLVLVAQLAGNVQATQIVASSNPVTNETFTGVLTNIPRTFANPTATSIVQVVNTSNGFILPTTSYTLTSASQWTMTNLTFNSTVAGNLSISYLYSSNVATVAGNIGTNVLSGFNQLGQLWPTIALTVGFIIVISLLVGTLYSRLKGSGNAG